MQGLDADKGRLLKDTLCERIQFPRSLRNDPFGLRFAKASCQGATSQTAEKLNCKRAGQVL
jgi:hypothetical protein